MQPRRRRAVALPRPHTCRNTSGLVTCVGRDVTVSLKDLNSPILTYVGLPRYTRSASVSSCCQCRAIKDSLRVCSTSLRTSPSNPYHPSMSGGLCYALSLSLILISLPAAAVAFNISYSAPTQCGPFNVTWEDGATITTLRILPFDAQAIVINMGIDAAHDKIAKTYTYTVDNLPLGSGTQFVAAADYAFSTPFSAHSIHFGVLTRSPWVLSFNST